MTNAERGVSAAGGREALTPDERRAYDKLVDAYQGRFPLSGNGALAVLELIDRLAALAPRAGEARKDGEDAERWRFVRQFLDTDGDVDESSMAARHYQWVRVNDEALHERTCAAGWTHTVESLVDVARAAVAGAGEE
jgi:hypothetical protein